VLLTLHNSYAEYGLNSRLRDYTMTVCLYVLLDVYCLPALANIETCRHISNIQLYLCNMRPRNCTYAFCLAQ
jgi:hypothetical protein